MQTCLNQSVIVQIPKISTDRDPKWFENFAISRISNFLRILAFPKHFDHLKIFWILRKFRQFSQNFWTTPELSLSPHLPQDVSLLRKFRISPRYFRANELSCVAERVGGNGFSNDRVSRWWFVWSIRIAWHESHGKPTANVKRGGVGYNSRSTRPNRDQIHVVRKGVLWFKGTISPRRTTSVESLRLMRPEPDDTNIPQEDALINRCNWILFAAIRHRVTSSGVSLLVLQ